MSYHDIGVIYLNENCTDDYIKNRQYFTTAVVDNIHAICVNIVNTNLVYRLYTSTLLGTIYISQGLRHTSSIWETYRIIKDNTLVGVHQETNII